MEGAFWEQLDMNELDEDEAEQEEAGQEEVVEPGQQADSERFKNDMKTRIDRMRADIGGEKNLKKNDGTHGGNGKFEDGTFHRIDDILDEAIRHLGPGFVEPKPETGRFVSANGKKVFRMGESDILGKHGGGAHVNFERLEPNPAKPGKMTVVEDIHIYLED